jgi:hypothetical protein
LTVTPPAGFEVSLSSGSSYSTNLSVPYSTSTLAGTTVYVRLAATTALGTYSGNITVAGGGDAEVIATAASVITSGTTTATTLLLTNSVGVTNYYGQPLIFTAVVQTNSVTAADASSNVVFSLGSTPVWTNAVAGGVAYYTNNDLTAGVTNFTAQYLGDINYLGSSVTVTQTVLQAAPTLTLTASGITYGQTLASSSLGGSAATNANNAASVPGGFAFADNTIAPNAGTTNVWVIFTPTDTTNYATVSNTVIVTVGQLGITITAQPNTKVFDGFTTATNVPTVTGTLASGDGFSSLTEAYATATVGTGKTVIPSATITNASGTATANYAITAVNDTGSVITSAVSTNALLLSLGLTPAGTLYPTFGAGQNIYTATNAYTNNPVTVTATSSNVNATLQFSFNGGAYGAVVTNTLTSGSTSLLLNPPTNTVAVRVVSQDLSQTNVYTVNVLLQPSQTVPHLMNSVSGNNLVLSWPADHLGYHLLVQTNNLNKGVSGNSSDWGPVAGSTAITSTNIAIIKTGVTNEYYKLVYP